MDKILDEMLKIQKDFQNKFPVETLKYSDIAGAISSEAMEIWHDTDGRWWKKGFFDCNIYSTMGCTQCSVPDHTKCGMKQLPDYTKCDMKQLLDHLKEESIDILHFLLILWLKLGMDEKEIFDKYKEKMGVNIKRQNDGY